MRRSAQTLLFVALLTCAPAWSSDACSTRAVITRADVSVSDGTSFSTESWFQSADVAAIRHVRETEQVVAVEGPLGWARVGDESMRGADFHKTFALGHQYHAFLLYFDEIVTNIDRRNDFDFEGDTYTALVGDYPYGGQVALVEGSNRPVAMVFEFPEIEPIKVTFDDWGAVGGNELPFLVSIDDGERVFDYRYTSVDLDDRSPLWFFDAAGDPGVDEVAVHRLHRTLLAAHCLGDADLLADRSTDPVTSANNGELRSSAREATRERFTDVFEALDYTEYHDIETPVVEVSGDVAWIGVNVRAVGEVKASGQPFDSEWAWIMVARKVDGQWYHAGNASNRKQEQDAQ